MSMGDVHLSSLASSRVLANLDLLYAVFTFVPLASGTGRDGHDLSQCAAVCRTFHEPAIRVLWRNLCSLLPLWSLLAPSDVPFSANYFSTTRYDVLEYLQKVISAQLYRDPIRWERFLYHAAQVRGIAHRGHMGQEINDANRLLIRAVITHNGETPICPLLHDILWTTHQADDTLISFFTPTLRHATFSLIDPVEGEIVSLLRRLRDSCPFLEKIDFVPGSEPDAALSLMQELARFPRLRQIKVSDCWGVKAFRVLATKPSLDSLSIPDLILGSWVGPRDVVSVRDLRELSLGGDASSLSCLFSLTRFHALKSANIYIDSCEAETSLTMADITDLLALFYNAVSTSDLQSFGFTPWPHRFEAPFEAKPPLRELIAPILPIRGLLSFTLIAKYPVASLDDADIEALASAWPGLQHFSAGRGAFTSGSSVSLHGLHCLRRHCADLLELSVPRIRWPVIGVDAIPTPLDDRSLAHPLQELSLPSQVVPKTDLPVSGSGAELSDEGAEAVAQYLLALFPRLDLDRCKSVWEESRPREGGMRFRTNSASRRRLGPEDLHFDDRWWRVIGHVYSLCRVRDGF